jgi:hypothetical protein
MPLIFVYASMKARYGRAVVRMMSWRVAISALVKYHLLKEESRKLREVELPVDREEAQEAYALATEELDLAKEREKIARAASRRAWQVPRNAPASSVKLWNL